jgi:hypothetical protein
MAATATTLHTDRNRVIMTPFGRGTSVTMPSAGVGLDRRSFGSADSERSNTCGNGEPVALLGSAVEHDDCEPAITAIGSVGFIRPARVDAEAAKPVPRLAAEGRTATKGFMP